MNKMIHIIIMNYNIITVLTPALSFCEYELGFFPKQKIDCAVKNFIYRAFLFAGNFFSFLHF